MDIQNSTLKTIRSVLLILVGFALVFYSIYQSLMPGYNFFPTSWGIFQGHKDIGGIYYFALGLALIVWGIFDPNARWNMPKKKEI